MVSEIKIWYKLLADLVRYNLKIIFSGVFIYFAAAAGLVLFLLILLVAYNTDAVMPLPDSAYYMLLLPGIVILLYPTAYGIQNDMDTKMMEVLIGIPNYRYKIWVVRMAIVGLVELLITLVFCLIVDLIFIPMNIFEMAYQLMYPFLFLSMLTFMISTLVRSGPGTAAVTIIIMLIFFILSGPLVESQWNLFLNPFENPTDISEMIWMDRILYNRVVLAIGTVIFSLVSLYSLQKRHRFI
ncbi:MAG: hypothetical protein JXR46_12190 [Calditrichaceae bacterium]|nr:hypothetical protein [Calditrichaceae bacterium]